MMRGKHKAGKWYVNDIKVIWYCRNCWQKGLAGISAKDGAIPVKDIAEIVQTTCHTDCKKPDIRWFI